MNTLKGFFRQLIYLMFATTINTPIWETEDLYDKLLFFFFFFRCGGLPEERRYNQKNIDRHEISTGQDSAAKDQVSRDLQLRDAMERSS